LTKPRLSQLKIYGECACAVRPDLDKELGVEATSSIAAKLRELTHTHHCDISFDPDRSAIRISGNNDEVERIQSLIDIYQNTPPTQIRTLTKIITIPEGALTHVAINDQVPQLDGKSTLILSDGQSQMLMRLLAQTREADIMSAPSGISRPNEQLTIEIIREIIFPSVTDPATFSKDWTGFKITAQPALLGFGITPQLLFNRGIMDTTHNNDTAISIRHIQDQVENYTPTNRTIIAPIQSEKGKTSYLFLTMQEIDATGARITR
jgi:hypothetical protein